MGQDDEEPPIRLILAALFHAARTVGSATVHSADVRAGLIAAAIADADELLKQAAPP